MSARQISRTVGRAGLAALMVLMIVLVQRSFTEDDRIRAAVAQLRAEQEVRRTEDCRRWRSEADVDLTPTSTDLARVIVRNAAAQYASNKCQDRTGPMPPVDSEAYQRPPTPAPTPTGRR